MLNHGLQGVESSKRTFYPNRLRRLCCGWHWDPASSNRSEILTVFSLDVAILRPSCSQKDLEAGEAAASFQSFASLNDRMCSVIERTD